MEINEKNFNLFSEVLKIKNFSLIYKINIFYKLLKLILILNFYNLIFIFFFFRFLKFSYNHKHLLIILLRLEFIILIIYFFLINYLSLFELELFFRMIFLVFRVCEGVLGLSILILIIRIHGNDNFQILNIL